MRVLSVLSLLSFFVLGCNQATSYSAGTNHVIPVQMLVGNGSVAKIGDQEISEKDMMEWMKGRVRGEYVKAQSEFYSVQERTLDEFLLETLAAKKAEKTKTSKEDFLKKEIDGKLKKITEADMKKFYDDFAKQAGGRGLPPFDQVKGQIEGKLKEDAMVARKADVLSQLKKEFNVSALISPPRVEVSTGDNMVWGAPNAPVTIVEFSDFECPFCKKGADNLKAAVKKFPGKVKVHFRDYPLPFHKKAKDAATAARCAGEQGKYWEMHDQLFADQRSEKGWAHADQKATPEETQANMEKAFSMYAKNMRLNVNTFQSCLKDKKFNAVIDADMAAGTDLGVNGTPAFFVNGIPMQPGARPTEEFVALIEQELARTKVVAKTHP